MKRTAQATGLSVLAALAACALALAAGRDFSAWSPATRVEAATGTDPSFNGAGLDGCPFISRDGKTSPNGRCTIWAGSTSGSRRARASATRGAHRQM